MTPIDVANLSTNELMRRRGELAQGMQHLALEGLPQDPDDVREVEALDAELRRRTRGPHAPSGR